MIKVNYINKRIIPYIIFLFVSISFVALSIPFPECYHFAGITSLFYGLYFAIGSGNTVLICVTLCMFPFAFVAYGYTLWLAIKKNIIFPSFCFIILELCATLILLVIKVLFIDCFGLHIMIIGFILRLIYCLWTYYYSFIAHKQ